MAKKTPTPSSKKKSTSAKKTPVKKSAPKQASATKKTSTTKSVTKKPSPKKLTKAPAKKAAPAKKPSPKKSVKKTVVKKTPTKPKAAAKPAKKSSAKTAAAPKAAATKAATKKTAAKETSAPAPAEQAPAPKAPAAKAVKPSGRSALRSRILSKGKAGKSVSFSLDEVKAIAKTTKTKKEAAETKKVEKKVDKTAEIEAKLAAAKPARVAAASLADILGFNPTAGAKAVYNDPKKVPEKFRRFFKLLIELRTLLTGQIDQHSEETLKRSSKDDAGDLSSYGQHMADAGTDTFDRDFALSLVANEQEALAEIEAAITRINKGTYGVCEVNGKPIDKERLLAVPFTRYSAEAQKELERNRHRVRTQAGLLIDGDDAAPMRDPSNDDD